MGGHRPLRAHPAGAEALVTSSSQPRQSPARLSANSSPIIQCPADSRSRVWPPSLPTWASTIAREWIWSLPPAKPRTGAPILLGAHQGRGEGVEPPVVGLEQRPAALRRQRARGSILRSPRLLSVEAPLGEAPMGLDRGSPAPPHQRQAQPAQKIAGAPGSPGGRRRDEDQGRNACALAGELGHKAAQRMADQDRRRGLKGTKIGDRAGVSRHGCAPHGRRRIVPPMAGKVEGQNAPALALEGDFEQVKNNPPAERAMDHDNGARHWKFLHGQAWKGEAVLIGQACVSVSGPNASITRR